MFDRIAARYDLLNRVLSLGQDQAWRRRTVRALALAPGQRLLDLATGTADLALLAAASGAEVVGLDPSPGMLQIARAKRERSACADRVTFEEGDACALPFPDDSFDACSIAFGIRNVPDRTRALREMARVTRPGGRVAVLELTEPAEGWLAPLSRFHVHRVVPLLGCLLSGAREYRYLQESIAAFPPPAEFASMMEAAGMRVSDVRGLTLGSCHLFVATVGESA